MKRGILWVLLVVVAAAAAVLSFATLRGLAELCGFSPELSPLLPITIDAGAAAGCLVWLGQVGAGTARGYARVLTLALLASSVAGNALQHYLSAYGLRPHWVLVVAVSAVAPAVLGAVVHLGALLSRGEADTEVPVCEDITRDPALAATQVGRADEREAPGEDRVPVVVAAGIGRRRLAAELGVSEHQARQILARSRNGQEREENDDRA